MKTANPLTDKAKIVEALKAFDSGSLASNASHLFDTLGYRSSKTIQLEPNTSAGLLELANRADFLNPAKAHADEWQSVDFLFQLTDEEIRNLAQGGLDFDSKADVQSNKLIESYIFFAVELRGASCPRSVLADITREINRLFPMPALVLFKHGKALTLSIINRRIHKRDAARDVLEKVTLIKDIRIEEPHRGQVEILFDLAFPQLIAKYEVTNFVQLEEAWRKTLDTSELNKRFYKDLANWYFWALQHVEFPQQEGVADDVNRATNVIRLITRLIFVWFLKERELVPDALFDRNELSEVLKDLSDDKSTFYKAILQNLFFATLNTPMNDKKAPRAFRHETNGKRFNDQYMVHNQYRHERLFRDSKQALGMFAGIPFLNGGLFECLDKRDEVNGKLIETRIDGFSDMPKKQPTVPNKLFFGDEEQIDLNEIYGTSKKRYAVRGLIDTLDRYKFTIAENTPIEEEVALDPELLGKVFENLLASYNPETGATARKQTGSFYTPREIVNYMVDESLIAYLESQFGSETNAQNGSDVNLRLRQLFAYTDEPHQFSYEEVDKLIAAIDRVKILDPACGSGAFPMGILQKLVLILAKLDPNNAKWEQRQIERVREAMRAAERIEDHKFRENTLQDLQAQIASIEEAFARNELDYGRKLFLIENCIYGVDIQPIAIQIAKLRFFISLVIDQTIRAQAENLGIRPLPNLETKFIAANSLVSLEKPERVFLRNTAIDERERELKIVRERYFTARTTRTKDKYRHEDERLRREIGSLLEQEGNFPHATTERLIAWDPYDHNATADFFDPEWMFGVQDGFQIAISNPPYIKEYTRRNAFDGVRNSACYQGKMDLWYLFACQGLDLLQKKLGVLCFIATNNWTTNAGASKMRNRVFKDATIAMLLDFGSYMIFESADIQTMVMIFRNDGTPDNYILDYRRLKGENLHFHDVIDLLARNDSANVEFLTPTINRNKFVDSTITFSDYKFESVLIKISNKANFHLLEKEVAQGIVPNPDVINKSSLEKIAAKKVLTHQIKVGDGVFVVDHNHFAAEGISKEELERLKPLYEPFEMEKFYLPRLPRKAIIYLTKKYPSERYPNLVSHLEKFREVMDDRRENQMRRLDFFHLHWSRDERFFDRGEKILSVRKCLRPTFVFTVEPAYVMMSINVIKSDRINLKFLTALLNSNLTAFWLLHKGKMQGSNYQIDKEPLLAIPIHKPSDSKQAPISKLVDQVVAAKLQDPNVDTTGLEREIDRLMYQLYDLTPEEIAIVNASVER